MVKPSTIDSFFKRKSTNCSETPISENPLTKSQRTEIKESENNALERDPGLRPQIGEYHINQRDEIRRAYIKVGPYQPILSKYPKSGPVTHSRSFQHSWFKLFPSWLEYSPEKDVTFCLPCFLFCFATSLFVH